MKAELINPFLASTRNVLKMMANTAVTSEKPRVKDDKVTYGIVTGIIGMASDKINGSMILSFEEQCILHVVANMLMEPVKENVDDDIVDAVGELTNMICGGAKTELAKLDQEFELAIPTMIVGKGVQIKLYSEYPTIVIPFFTDKGRFVVEANLGPRSQNK